MTGHMKGWMTLVTIALLVSMAPVAVAQQTGTVTGTVADASGALIPGVGVDATNTNTNITRSAISGEAGSYTIQALQAGPYSITASLPGFADSTIEVNLTANQVFRYNFVMRVAGVATQVEVISDADALLASTSSSVGDALPTYEIDALPLATRDVFDLLATTAGVVRTQGGDGVHFAGTRNSSVNTTRDGIVASDGRYMDWNGAYSATFTSPDLVEEIQISVGTVDSAAGRGSGQVRLQTRSGTNEYHGALFYATNNSAFNANSWFNNLNGNEPNWTNRQQFGGRLGGPIIEDKAFFFVLLDEQRYRTRQNVNTTVWTDQARNGIFRYFPGSGPDFDGNQDANAGANASVNADGSIRDWTQIPGVTGPLVSVDLFDIGSTFDGVSPIGSGTANLLANDPLRGTAITSNPFIQRTINLMPSPNQFTGGDGLNTAVFNWVRRVSGIESAAGTSPNTNRDNLNMRFDYTVTENNKVSFVYTREHNFSDSSNPAWPTGTPGEATRDPRIMSVGYTSTISPTIVNEARFGYRQTSWHGRPAYAVGCCFGDEGGLETADESALEIQALLSETPNGYRYQPRITTGGVGWVSGPNGSRSQVSPLYQVGDTISIVSGSHSLQSGFDWTHAASHGWNTGEMEPDVNIGSGAFPVTVVDNFNEIDGSDANLAEGMLNDLSGSVGSLSQTFLVNNTAVGFVDVQDTIKQKLDFTQIDWGVFGKDTWNVTNNLTLTLGIRWDVYGVPWEPNGLAVIPTGNRFLGISDPNDQSLVGFSPVGKGSLNPDQQVYPDDWNNIAPSFGFSYRVPWLDRPTVVRGGYGISYSAQATFLQYDFGVGRQAGKSYSAAVTPLAFTQAPGSDGAGVDLELPLLDIVDVGGINELRDPNDPTFEYRQFDTVGENSSLRSNGTLFAYADDRRTPYIQNFNLSVETEIARDTNLSVAYLGTMGVSMWGGYQANEVNIFAQDTAFSDETFLDAFNITRAGGTSTLFDAMLAGRTGDEGIVGTDVWDHDNDAGTADVLFTGSDFLREWGTTDDWLADGEVARLAEFMAETNQRTDEMNGVAVPDEYAGLLGPLPENFIKANSQFGQVDVYDNSDASNYHALQVQVTKRLSDGFSGQLSYTWSKNMGNSATSTFNAREDQSFGTRDPNNRALQWGLVGFHRTHQINAHGVWNLPFGPGRAFGSGAPSAVARIIEGWTLSGIFGWDSGSPIPVTTGFETLAGEDDINTPNLVGDFPRSLGEVVVKDNGRVEFLDGFQRVQVIPAGVDPRLLSGSTDQIFEIQDPNGNSVLQNPDPGTTGNLAYNWLTGPTSLQFDAAMEKSIQFQEGREFSLRVDAINLLNTPQWGNPNLNINSSSFGRITSAGGARTFTLNARIDF